MTICPYCGTENEDGSRFCLNCGADMSEPDAAAVAGAPVQPEAYQPNAAPASTSQATYVPEAAPQAGPTEPNPQVPPVSASPSQAAYQAATTPAGQAAYQPTPTPGPEPGQASYQPTPGPSPQPAATAPAPAAKHGPDMRIVAGIAAAIVVVLLVVLVMPSLTSGSTDTPAEPATPDPVETTPEPSEPAAPVTYYLGVSEGYVAIYASDQATPYEVSDVRVSDLGSASAAAIDAHVAVSSPGDARALIDSYRQEAENLAAQNAQAAAAPQPTPAQPAPTPPRFTSASCSSYLDSDEFVATYYPEYVLDGNRETGWVEGDQGSDGLGEWVAIEAGSPQTVSGISILNGYSKGSDDTLYYENNRCRGVTIQLSDGYQISATLADVFCTWQDIDFDGPHQTTYVRVIIDSVYSGSRWNDTVIDELSAY